MALEGGLGARLRGVLAALNPWRAAARAEAEARAAEQRLREALDALPTGVVVLDSALRIGVERGDYPAAIGREDAWLAERLELLRHPTGEHHEQQIRDGRWVLIE